MCFGKALIASDRVGAGRDLIKQDWNGLIYPMGDMDALADCLKRALADRSQLRTWGEHSAELVKNYSYEAATRGLCAAVDHVSGGVAAR